MKCQECKQAFEGCIRKDDPPQWHTLLTSTLKDLPCTPGAKEIAPCLLCGEYIPDNKLSQHMREDH